MVESRMMIEVLPIRADTFTVFSGGRSAELLVKEKARLIGGHWMSVLAHGRNFSEVDLAASERLRVQYGCKLGDCFVNCGRIAAIEDHLSYTQGLASADGR